MKMECKGAKQIKKASSSSESSDLDDSNSSDKEPTMIEPLNDDPFVGGLETPITSSSQIARYLSNLPAYKTAVRVLCCCGDRGRLAYGFLLVGPL
ncbi:hypothetical protein L7F22_035845 [Adiantum nelumboides]|nr:hypothetical protein [Adiantum nelumboides]